MNLTSPPTTTRRSAACGPGLDGVKATPIVIFSSGCKVRVSVFGWTSHAARFPAFETRPSTAMSIGVELQFSRVMVWRLLIWARLIGPNDRAPGDTAAPALMYERTTSIVNGPRPITFQVSVPSSRPAPADMLGCTLAIADRIGASRAVPSIA